MIHTAKMVLVIVITALIWLPLYLLAEWFAMFRDCVEEFIRTLCLMLRI